MGVDATGSGSGSGTGGDAPAADDSRVYAHSGTILYKVDTTDLSTSQIGALAPLAMNGSGSNAVPDKVNDIAIDKDHHMTGVGAKTLYEIDPETGAILSSKPLVGGTTYASLSYIPSPAGDILITADKQGDVWQIDTATGTATKVGNYGKVGSDAIVSSGDIVGIQGLGVFATVDVGTMGSDTNDYLAKIDPDNGYKATIIGSGTGYNRIFGLAFWAGKLYGFVDNTDTHTGQIITIDPTSGLGGQAPQNGAVEWYGAGVETTAPIIGKQH